MALAYIDRQSDMWMLSGVMLMRSPPRSGAFVTLLYKKEPQLLSSVCQDLFLFDKKEV
jgi:hypothetical protein